MAKGYKLFKIRNGKLYPLYVFSNEETKMNVWLEAKDGEIHSDGKHVKSKLGALCFRPGWHLSEIPLATHIGKKSDDGTLHQKEDTVWCEVEYSDEINYQPEANRNGRNKQGRVIPKNAYLKSVPRRGYYHYKTNPNMYSDWIIAGSIKVNRILSNDEVDYICSSVGLESQKRVV